MTSNLATILRSIEDELHRLHLKTEFGPIDQTDITSLYKHLAASTRRANELRGKIDDAIAYEQSGSTTRRAPECPKGLGLG